MKILRIIKSFNNYLKKYWTAKYNIGLRKIIFIILIFLCFGILVSMFFNTITPFIVSLISILAIIMILLYFLRNHGYNEKILVNSDSDFILYDNKNFFYNRNNTRILKSSGLMTYSKAWTSVDRNKKDSAFLPGLIELIPIKMVNKKDPILHLGGCCNSIALYFATKYPSSSHDVVEIDENFIKISKEYFYPLFGKNRYKNINIFNDDAKNYINKNNKKYTVIIQDVFQNNIIPEYFLSGKWIGNIFSKSLKDNGLFIMNIGVMSAEMMFNFITSLPKNILKNIKDTLVCIFTIKINKTNTYKL